MTEKKRDLNLDLIRSFALVAVLVMHYYDNSGFYTIAMDGPGDFAMALVRMLFVPCVPLFIMLTGWLCRDKVLSWRYYLGMLRILEIYLLSSLACLVFEFAYLGNRPSLLRIISDIINFEINGYAWYILLYGGLFLMIPFLNMMYRGCTGQRQKQLLVFSFLALSVLPSLFNSFFQIYSIWWAKLYPICYYFTGAYLGEYLERKKPGKYALALISGLLLFCLFNQFYFHGQAEGYNNIHYDHYQAYILSVLLFALLASLDLGRLPSWCAKLIYKIAELSFAAYLLSWISDGIIYREFVPYFPVPEDRFIWILVLIPLSLIFSLLMAQLVHWVYTPIDRLIRGRLLALLPPSQGN